MNFESYISSLDLAGMNSFRQDMETNFVGAFTSRFVLTSDQTLTLSNWDQATKDFIINFVIDLEQAMITHNITHWETDYIGIDLLVVPRKQVNRNKYLILLILIHLVLR